MRNKLILVTLGLLATALIWSLALASGAGGTLTAERVGDPHSAGDASQRAACSMTKTNSTIASYFSGFAPGMSNVTYFNPAVECGTPTYPFEITDFSFTLYDFMLVGSASLDIVVYDLASAGDTCAGPGDELCRYSLVADDAFIDPNTGTFVFPTPCCVDGPFFIGIEYTGGNAGSIPSLFYDDQTPDTCDNWFFYDGSWYEWYDLWTQPGPGYPLCWVGGETVSANCQGCTWEPGDLHKMHFPQLPDTTGWDVNATAPVVLADDWQCSETGWIKDFHFWGSWKDDIVGEIEYFVLSIHDNIPEGGQYGQCFADGDCNGDGVGLSISDLIHLIQYVFQGGPPCIPWYSGDMNGDCIIDSRDIIVYQDYFTYGITVFAPYGGYPVPTCCDSILHSRPGNTLWEYDVADFDIVAFDPPTMEGWYDPSTGEVLPDNHVAYFQYNICLPEQQWFWQEQDSIYWLNISAVLTDPQGTQWGWKSSYDHFMDDAVWAYWGELEWEEMYEPADPIGNLYWIGFDEFGNIIPPLSGGVGYYNTGDSVNGWFYYPETEWWNIWFYDHPFTYDREKIARFEFDIFPYNEQEPWNATVAINWATDAWSLEGQPPGDSMPPVPGYYPEELFIGRDIFLQGEFEPGHYIFTWPWRDYNPEWVSIDVQGYNFVIPEGMGIIEHTCRQSLDLAFVVTGGEDIPRGACCYDDPTGMLCVQTTQDSCLNVYFGTYMGDGTLCGGGIEACCLPGGGCIDADPFCCTNVLGGVPQGAGTACQAPEACCLQDYSCVMADPLCCLNILGGAPQGPGTVCTAEEACCLQSGDCIMADPLCCDDLGGAPQGPGSVCTALEACCLPNGDCIMADPLCCDDLGGVPQGAGTVCSAPEACCMPDASCQMLDPLCCDDLGGTPQGAGTQCTATKACCFADGSCMDVDPLCCDDLGGFLSPSGAPACLGDNDGDGTDDACGECSWEPGDPYKSHYPQLPDEFGWDVNATGNGVAFPPLVLADDWMCTDSGWVKDIHFWGSWLHGIEGEVIQFLVSIHSDIPADPPQLPYSRPGPILWEREIANFGVTPFDPPAFEGWYDPASGQFLFDDHQEYFRYDICLDSLDWFWQNEGTIYWLNISAFVADPVNTAWGWKSSLDHWNDDAVWAFLGDYNWIDMFEPPDFMQSLDLSFVITGGDVCDCVPGDADGNTIINISDAVYLIGYIFGGGPPPTPYPICSGDADCNCIVNISDAVYLISYIFGGGPAPCTCEQWLINCGPPLR